MLSEVAKRFFKLRTHHHNIIGRADGGGGVGGAAATVVTQAAPALSADNDCCCCCSMAGDSGCIVGGSFGDADDEVARCGICRQSIRRDDSTTVDDNPVKTAPAGQTCARNRRCQQLRGRCGKLTTTRFYWSLGALSVCIVALDLLLLLYVQQRTVATGGLDATEVRRLVRTETAAAAWAALQATDNFAGGQLRGEIGRPDK